MYKAFYNLKRNPFEITPDPFFLFPTRRHNEALAALYYGVRRHKGFVVMTGEVGTGKTLLVRCLLQLLSRSNVTYAYVFNPRLAPTEFLQYVAGDFRLPTAGKTKSDFLLDLSSFVISRHQKGLTTVLVVDEAHHLPVEVLEEIRLLTNLETAQEKLLQILLVGQPELDEKLDSVDLRQLKQRIALRSHLAPLDINETKGYIHRRLQLAGCANPGALFPDNTILEIPLLARDRAFDQYTVRKRADPWLCTAGAGNHTRDDRGNRGGFPHERDASFVRQDGGRRRTSDRGAASRQDVAGPLHLYAAHPVERDRSARRSGNRKET